MPNYYMVKSGGTATGDGGRYTSQITGSSFANAKTDDWGTKGHATAAEYYYDSIIDAIDNSTTSPVAGDYILVSSAHDKNHGNSTKTIIGPTGAFIHIVSVSDTAVDTYTAGASEYSDTSASFRFSYKVSSKGVDYSAGFYVATVQANSAVYLEDSTITLTGSQDYFGPIQDGCLMQLIGCTIATDNLTTGMRIVGGSLLKLIDCTWAGAANAEGLFSENSMGDGGGRVELIGCDISGLSATGYVFNNHGNNQGFDDGIQVILHRCKLPSGISWVEEVIDNPDSFILATECDATSADSEWQFYYEDYFGTIESVPDNVSGGIVRNTGGNTFNGGRKISYKYTSNANATLLTPLVAPIPVKFCELSNAASDVIRVYVASTSSLTDIDVWARCVYMDGTNKQTPNFISTANSDPLSAGTALTTDSGSDWEDNAVDLTGHNEYYIEIDTSTDAGADGVPYIEICVGKASTTIYVDSEIGLV